MGPQANAPVVLERRFPAVVAALSLVGVVVAVPEVTGAGHYLALATLPPAVGVVVAAHRLRRQFGVPVFAVSVRSSRNWWYGAAGGTVAFVGSLLFPWWARSLETARVPSAVLLAATLLGFVWLTVHGGTLRDVADGEVVVDAREPAD